MTIELNVATLIYVASCITIIGGALGVLIKAKNALLAPLKEINEKLAQHETFLANDKKHLEKIDYILDYLLKCNTLLLKNTNTMMRHMEDGNHTGEIKERIKETEDFTLEGMNQWKTGL